MDTFPTTNLESLACGTPVITYRSGGSPEAINQDTGLVLEKGDVNGMSTAIQLIASKGKQQYKEVCRKHAETYFNKNIQFEKYINLYTEQSEKYCLNFFMQPTFPYRTNTILMRQFLL